MPDPAPRSSRLFAAGLPLLLLAVGFFLYGPTLAASWAYDDMDYFNLVGDALAGKAGYWQTVFHPHHEHLVPVLVMVFHASAALFGAEALPFRLLVLLSHIGAAGFLALAARRYGGDRAGLATGLAYLAPAGFSSMWVWLVNGAGVPFGIFGLSAALAALAWRDRLGVGRARFLAGAAVVLGLLCESALAPLAAGPALLDEYERRRAGRKGVGPFSVACLLLAAAVVGLATWFHHRIYGGGFQVSLRHGLPRAAFLLLAAPLRYFFPGLRLTDFGGPGAAAAVYGSLYGLAIAAAAAALLVALWRRGAPRLAWIAALAAAGPVGVVALVGLGRSRAYYADLYDADRYFFFLLPPIALLAGAAAASAGERVAAWGRRERAALLAALAVLGGAELLIHRQALLYRVPIQVFAAHERRLDQLARLADRLSAAAGALPANAPPLRFPDDSFWFPDVHNGKISARFVLHALARRPRPVLGDPGVGERDARLLAPVLDAWTREIGEPALFAIAGGRLVKPGEISRADFRAAAHDAQVVSGFHPWEGGSRWMGPRGELRLFLRESSTFWLEMAAPLDALRRKQADWTAFEVRVTIVDEGSGLAEPLGTVRVTEDGIRSYPVDASPVTRRLGNGRTVHLVLECERSWRPAEVFPGSTDTRELTVQVLSAGF